ncbi:MotA/TolQ/ExbB proton channel family protein [Reichenbachiella versicolor]|uniref:MotA/TolQ/ExbB proton channel family protein n=1 Tax=Reichenbachiella versicolor TaxID=1821036 RepID=UPI000D6E3537|nr:MotA/TolQ/ExbB proton channel family protein [Reichenbachiella versicolor]
MNILESLLLAIANLLYYPVLIGVLFVLAQQCLAIGKFLNELKRRRSKQFKQIDSFKAEFEEYMKTPASSIKELEFDLIGLLRNWRHSYLSSLSPNRLVVKAGPALGLMGTLIPMGTALSSLSQGDLMIMSANMVTAFTTTVVGMASGLSAFLLNHKQSEWMKKDLLECETLCEQHLIQKEKSINE